MIPLALVKLACPWDEYSYTLYPLLPNRKGKKKKWLIHFRPRLHYMHSHLNSYVLTYYGKPFLEVLAHLESIVILIVMTRVPLLNLNLS